MLNQVSRALAALIRPIASRAVQTDADRDAMGQAYENLHQEKDGKEDPKQAAADALSVGHGNEPSPAQPVAQVIPLQPKTPEQLAEARSREIATSQAWIGLKTALTDQTSSSRNNAGPAAYEKATTTTSKAAGAKKGVIVDKKAA